ncbi:MAG: hypothetical protein Q7T07_04410, partial [Burkholderiaceae bacterium]|nr:hypothetical protein [Burkholderiaceae bacterium]
TFKLPNPARGPGVPKETMGQAGYPLRQFALKRQCSAEMTDLALVRVSSEPAFKHGLGIVGDSGERSDAHPVHEIESNWTFPMALPFINHCGGCHGRSQARRRGVSPCRRH